MVIINNVINAESEMRNLQRLLDHYNSLWDSSPEFDQLVKSTEEYITYISSDEFPFTMMTPPGNIMQLQYITTPEHWCIVYLDLINKEIRNSGHMRGGIYGLTGFKIDDKQHMEQLCLLSKMALDCYYVYKLCKGE